jgi:cyclopropane fatty-acyl-phospholipid synthase-like methyltransferase
MLPFSEACERNKGPILDILRDAFAPARRVLEIGSGTGQHAVWFARHLTHLQWQPTDRATELPGLRERIADEGTPNLLAPVELDVLVTPWPAPPADAVFSANTLHIMGWPGVEAFFAGIATVLAEDGATLAVYGPFRYRGSYTSPSNAAFDDWLKRRDPASGIRDFEAVDALARAAGLTLAADHAMPANNQLLVWRRGPAVAG